MHKAIKSSLLIIFLLSSIILLNVNFVKAAGTTLPSIISSDTILTQDGNPYSLIGPTRVNMGVTLTLQAGVTISFGSYYLQVEGTLRSIGTSDNPVTITSNRSIILSDPVAYLNFTNSCTSWNEQTGQGCIIQNTIINQTIIYINNSTVKINANTINFQGDMMHENIAVFINGGSTPMTNSDINAAVMTLGGASTISGNTITGGMGLYGGSPIVTNNKVSGHSTYYYFAKDENRVYNTIAISSTCSPTLSNNEVNGSIRSGDYRELAGKATITSNVIYGSVSGQGNLGISYNKILGSILTTGSNVTIQGNQVSGNNQNGISISDNAIVKYNSISGFNVSILVNPPSSGGSSFPTIKNNNIQGWGQYCIKNLASNDVDASGNWWGTTDTQAITQSIYDQAYDFNLGKVNINPILTAPDTTAPENQLVESSPTPAPTDSSPTPSVPEYSQVALLVLLVAATLATIMGIRKMSRKNLASLNV